jgi:hypothetical protein
MLMQPTDTAVAAPMVKPSPTYRHPYRHRQDMIRRMPYPLMLPAVATILSFASITGPDHRQQSLTTN